MQASQQLHSSSSLLKLKYCDPAALNQKYQVLAWLGKPGINLSSVSTVWTANLCAGTDTVTTEEKTTLVHAVVLWLNIVKTKTATKTAKIDLRGKEAIKWLKEKPGSGREAIPQQLETKYKEKIFSCSNPPNPLFLVSCAAN